MSDDGPRNMVACLTRSAMSADGNVAYLESVSKNKVVTNDQGMEFVAVPPGRYIRWEFPHQETVEIEITKTVHWQTTPVTIAQYYAYTDAAHVDNSYRIEVWDGEWRLGPTFADANSAGERYPVVGVSFHDAQAFIAWLNQHERAGHRYRLPTEAEYEYVMRAGCQCHRQCEGQSVLPQNKRNGTVSTCPYPVASNMPNEFGVYDMSGFIWHWCADWYAPYPTRDSQNPTGPVVEPNRSMWRGRELPAGRVIRGGSFSYPTEYYACDHRHFSFTADRNFNVGFRVVFDDHGAA
jgi:formylglycine-generating enzyme required for sulfatase activity